MAGEKLQSRASAIWALAEIQHGVVTRRQMLDLGLSSKAIEHRIDRGGACIRSGGAYTQSGDRT